MGGLYLLAPTILVVLISFLVVRAGAIALRLTGMNEQSARFQALSAFTRAGFTTRETEMVMKVPRRRRIISWLIVLGNAGIVTVIVTTTSSLVSAASANSLALNVLVLVVGIIVVYVVMQHTPIWRVWENFIEKRITREEITPETSVEDLLHIAEGYGLVNAYVTADSPLIGRSLVEVNTPENEFWVVGIERDKDWISLPTSREKIQEGDKLVVYGDLHHLKGLLIKSRSKR